MTQDISAIKSLLGKATEALVLLPQNPGPDSIASALSLAIALDAANKKSLIACATPIDFREFPLKQADRISQKIGNKNLVISLKIENRDSVDKVSYNLDELNKVFNLVISPKKGSNPLNSDAVSFSLAGARADVIFIVGAAGFDDLGSLYAAEPALFTETPTVAINRMNPTPFASYHLSRPEASSIAENMVHIIESLELNLNNDSATNLLAGIDVVTDKLQLANVTATTFEAVAKLIRAGGTRIMIGVTEVSNPSPSVSNPSAEVVMDVSEPIPQDWLEPKILKATPSDGQQV
jgi:nanoRNase/pAp phosphatase (c-di-AMP/oligoRNAs hydrolase)